MFVCWPHIVKYKLEVDSSVVQIAKAPCELCGVLDGDWSAKVLHRENALLVNLLHEQIATRVAAGEACCGRCAAYDGSDPCSCERCACGHCRHDHEKWRWHRLCRHCTPLAYMQEIPNEIDTRPLTMTVEERRTLPPPNYYDELAKHRPVGKTVSDKK